MNSKYIYRYVSAKTAKATIASQAFKVSNPSALNDPFEFATIDNSTGSDETQARIRSYRKEIARKLGFVCFSKVEPKSLNSILLWSHYGDECKGVCLAFDKSVLSQALRWQDISTNDGRIIPSYPYEVAYSKLRADMQITSPSPSSLQEFCLTKSLAWEYEEECRAFYPVEKEFPTFFSNDSHTNTNYYVANRARLVNFPREALVKIFFGSEYPRAQPLDNTQDDLINLLKKEHYWNDSFGVFLEIHPKNFEFEEII